MEGVGPSARSRWVRNWSTISSSSSEESVLNRRRYPRSRPQCPAGSMVAMSAPEAFTKIAGISSPSTFLQGSLTEELPPP